MENQSTLRCAVGVFLLNYFRRANHLHSEMDHLGPDMEDRYPPFPPAAILGGHGVHSPPSPTPNNHLSAEVHRLFRSSTESPSLTSERNHYFDQGDLRDWLL